MYPASQVSQASITLFGQTGAISNRNFGHNNLLLLNINF